MFQTLVFDIQSVYFPVSFLVSLALSLAFPPHLSLLSHLYHPSSQHQLAPAPSNQLHSILVPSPAVFLIVLCLLDNKIDELQLIMLASSFS